MTGTEPREHLGERSSRVPAAGTGSDATLPPEDLADASAVGIPVDLASGVGESTLAFEELWR